MHTLHYRNSATNLVIHMILLILITQLVGVIIMSGSVMIV